MSPVSETVVPISLPSSHSLLFYLTLKWKFIAKSTISYFFPQQIYIYTHTYIYVGLYLYLYMHLYVYLLNKGIQSGKNKEKLQGGPPWFELININKNNRRKNEVTDRQTDRWINV